MVAVDMVTLVSNDSVEMKIPLNLAQKMQLVSRMMEDLGESTKNQPIPIPRINGETLKLAIEYMTQHMEDIESSGNDNDDFSDWDKKFFDRLDQSAIFNLIMAANFLQIQNLLDSCCKWVAEMIKGKSVEEIRKTFGIKNDFTPEEEESIRQENAWCEE